MLNGLDGCIIGGNDNVAIHILNSFNTDGIQDTRRAVRLIDRNLCHERPFQKHILHLAHKGNGFLGLCSYRQHQGYHHH